MRPLLIALMDDEQGASGEVTYALRVCGGARLVVEARWHAGGAAFDVKVTDGVCLWRKEGALDRDRRGATLSGASPAARAQA